MTPDVFPDVDDLLTELERVGAEVIIVGAHALAAHGVPRATIDLDVWVRPTAENARRVMQALVAFGAPVQAHGLTESDLASVGTVYQMGVAPRRIDLLTSISGVDFEEAWRTRLTARLGGHDVAVLGRDALIRNKLATGRGKDLLDVRALQRADTDNGSD